MFVVRRRPCFVNSIFRDIKFRRTMAEDSENRKILITRPDIPAVGVNLLRKEYEVVMWNEPSPAPREFILKNIVGKCGLICFLSDKVDSELLNAAGPSLKVVATYSVGFNHINVEECKNRGIRLGHTPDVLTEATAELTIGLLLCVSRHLIEAQIVTASGGWSQWSPSWMTGPGLSGSTVGIVGFGRIGQSVALKIKAFNTAKILYYNRSIKTKEALPSQAQSVELEQLIHESDFIICCCALTKDTYKMFTHKMFSMMKRSCIFINTSRGEVVDQDALIHALESGVIKGAGLDVTTPEPLPLDNPLYKLHNCIILPHIGSGTFEARTNMAIMTAENIILALQGKSMPGEIV